MSITSRQRGQSFATSFAIQARVVSALMVREAQSKYSKETLGVLLDHRRTAAFDPRGHRDVDGDPSGRGPRPHRGLSLCVTAYSHIQLFGIMALGSLARSRRAAGCCITRTSRCSTYSWRDPFSSASASSRRSSSSPPLAFCSASCVRRSDPGLVIAAWCMDTMFAMAFASVLAGLSQFSDVVEKLAPGSVPDPAVERSVRDDPLAPAPGQTSRRVVAARARCRDVPGGRVRAFGQDDVECSPSC